jgi:anti-sigma factor RsiW
MNNCAKCREHLVLYMEGELDEVQSREVREHLEACAACCSERDVLEQVRGRLMDPGLFSPAADLAWHSLPQRTAERASSVSPVHRWLPSNFGSLGWALSMAAAVALCFGLVWWANRTALQPPVTATTPPPGNEAFLGKLQSVFAREATRCR